MTSRVTNVEEGACASTFWLGREARTCTTPARTLRVVRVTRVDLHSPGASHVDLLLGSRKIHQRQWAPVAIVIDRTASHPIKLMNSAVNGHYFRRGDSEGGAHHASHLLLSSVTTSGFCRIDAITRAVTILSDFSHQLRCESRVYGSFMNDNRHGHHLKNRRGDDRLLGPWCYL